MVPTWYCILENTHIESENDVPNKFIEGDYQPSDNFFVNAKGKLTFEYVDNDIYVYVDNLEIVKKSVRELFLKFPNIVVWNIFKYKKRENKWRFRFATPRSTREEIRERSVPYRFVGSFLYSDYIWLKPGDYLEIKSEIDGIIRLAVFK